MKNVLALDIGNAFGKASILELQDGDPISLLPPDEMRTGMPTTAYVDPVGNIKVYNVGKVKYDRAVTAVKTRFEEKEIFLQENGITYSVTPGQVYGAIAKELVKLANQYLRSRGSEPIYDLVITYPAAFAEKDNIRALMRQSVEAVEIDGHHLRVLRMLTEPIAAAIDELYFTRRLNSNLQAEEEQAVLVYDLGHGTFDVAVVSATTDQNEPFKQITQDGDSQIGGRILDELLYQEACRQLEDQLDFVPENANDVERIHQLVVEIKHELSREMDSERDFVSSEGDAVVHVTRKQFEEMIRETLQPTFEKVDELLRRADEKNVKVSEIVLTGGSSEIPYIKNCLETMTGKEIPVIKHRPTDAVVFGAARFAFNMPDINEENVKVEVGGQNGILTQITEYAYGVVLPKQPLMEEVEYMIQPGQTLPATTKAFVVCGDDRIKIRVRRSRHRGVSNPPTDRQNCEYYCDLPFEVGKNERCEFTMTLDENRFIQVTCRRTDGKTISKNSQNAWK